MEFDANVLNLPEPFPQVLKNRNESLPINRGGPSTDIKGVKGLTLQQWRIKIDFLLHRPFIGSERVVLVLDTIVGQYGHKILAEGDMKIKAGRDQRSRPCRLGRRHSKATGPAGDSLLKKGLPKAFSDNISASCLRVRPVAVGHFLIHYRESEEVWIREPVRIPELRSILRPLKRRG